MPFYRATTPHSIANTPASVDNRQNKPPLPTPRTTKTKQKGYTPKSPQIPPVNDSLINLMPQENREQASLPTHVTQVPEMLNLVVVQ